MCISCTIHVFLVVPVEGVKSEDKIDDVPASDAEPGEWSFITPSVAFGLSHTVRRYPRFMGSNPGCGRVLGYGSLLGVSQYG